MNARRVSIDDLIAARAAPTPPVLLDVRDRPESERDRIRDATNLPRHRIEFRIAGLVRDRTTPIVVIDSGAPDARGRVDPRAALAARTLRRLGYADVATVDGGVAAWRRAGLPVVCGIDVSISAFRERCQCNGEVQCISVETLLAWQREGTRVTLIDVRGAAEHTEACIPGAVSVNGFDIASQGVDIAAESDVIVVYSGGCTRAVISARTLTLLGLTDVVALEGGMIAWRLAGRAVERGSRLTRFAGSVGSHQFGALGAARLAKMRGVRGMAAGELAALLASPTRNFYAIDLRDTAAFEAGHIAGTLSLPIDRAILRSDEFIAIRGAPLVFVGDDETHARLVAVWQSRLGSTDVSVLAGGLAGWVAEGRPLSARRDDPLGWLQATTEGEAVDARQVATWLAAHPGGRVLQVDRSSAFRAGHLPGATWLPRAWLEARIDDVVADPRLPLLLTCVAGTQAPFAAATLRECGRGDVAWLAGGTRAWAVAGGALEASDLALQDDELVPPIQRDERAMREYLDWAGNAPGTRR
jgi:rhodanese-related sulfurtransferase